ncbi:ABC transporter ATP-binding protein [Fusibacter bizertensis]
MKALIECKNVIKTYVMGSERVDALKGINLTIYEGEFIALLGKSGSGKSTLLNMLAGLEKPTSGEIYLKGNPLHLLNETKITNIRKKHVGFIFQSYNLLPTHTALENVTLPLVFNRMGESEKLKRGKAMLESVGLEDRMYHKPMQMSGGQQQRVSIARAFINNPEIVFADEPTGNLDSKTTEDVMGLMLKMIDEHHQTFIMVTHDPETSLYADRIVYLKDGAIERIVNRGEADQLLGIHESK